MMPLHYVRYVAVSLTALTTYYRQGAEKTGTFGRERFLPCRYYPETSISRLVKQE